MKTFEVSYLTDSPGKAYAAAIRAAKSKAQLVEVILPYRKVADDALAVSRAMNPDDFPRFQNDLARAKRKNSNAWIDKFNTEWGAIAMPMKIIFASIVAERFHVPWGCAFIRLEEEGWPQLKESQSAAA
jgi:hypothetical protein